MGRIKTKLVKRITFELLEKHREQFSGNFNDNKEKVDRILIGVSKKLRNIIAGYTTRLVQKEKTLQ